jgi:hypothetical protein
MYAARSPLPLPEARDLDEVPSEFAGLLQPSTVLLGGLQRGSSLRSTFSRAPAIEPVQVIHLDEPRPSIYALFA